MANTGNNTKRAIADFTSIMQPEINMDQLKIQEHLHLPADFQLPKLSTNESWTMNVHKCIDKAAATKNGSLPDEPWIEKLSTCVNVDMHANIQEMAQFVLLKSVQFELVRERLQKQKEQALSMGLMRMGCIFSLMERQIQKDKVAANMHDVGKFRGLHALLVQESFNVMYVYDKLVGNQPRKSFLKCHFKNDQRPEENLNALIDDELAISNFQKASQRKQLEEDKQEDDDESDGKLERRLSGGIDKDIKVRGEFANDSPKEKVVTKK